MTRIYLLSLAVLSFIVSAITGCVTAPSPSTSPTPTFSKFLPPTWTPTNTVASTVTLMPTQTLSPTPTLTTIPSLTPLATLEADGAQKKLEYMIYQNGGCELPCWWGIVPGVTNRDDMINNMRTFISKIVSRESGYVDFGGEKIATRTIIYYDPKDESENHIFEVLSVEGVVERIEVYQDLTRQFTLAELLKTYGKPQQVLLATEPASPNGMVPFSLILSYAEQGILAHFFSEFGGKIRGDYIYICPQSILPELQLWPASESQQSEFEMKYLIKSIGSYYTNNNGLKYKPVETVSDLSIEKFYTVFQGKNTASCITTKAEQWWSN